MAFYDLQDRGRKLDESYFRHVVASKVIFSASDLDLESSLVALYWNRNTGGVRHTEVYPKDDARHIKISSHQLKQMARERVLTVFDMLGLRQHCH